MKPNPQAAENPVHVIGMGLSPKDLTQAHMDIIRSAQVLVGGKRHLSAFQDIHAIKREIAGPIDKVIEFIRENMAYRKVVVLASGDPLFFGIGKVLIEHLGKDRVVIHPNVTSMASAFARLGLSWQDAGWISLHGKKDMSRLRDVLDEKRLICVLTDPVNNPSAIAETVCGHRDSWKMWVLQRLGSKDEIIKCVDPGSARGEEFVQPNVVVLKKEELRDPPGPLCIGAPDHWFIHERGMITKAPVRAVSLSLLRLKKDHLLWDLGAGSGSVSVEASILLSAGRIYAVEKNRDRASQIRANADRFGVENLNVIHAEMPGCLDELPGPDRVFIGGGGKAFPEILEKAGRVLRPGGRIVVNTVLMETMNMAVTRLNKMKFKTEMIQLQVNRSKEMPSSLRMEALNPVWIIAGEKGD